MKLLIFSLLGMLSFFFIFGFSFTKKTKSKGIILCIFAHADDETTISPILHKYAQEGSNVYLAIATDGRYGVRPHANIPKGDSLVAIRIKEAICNAKLLGINPPIFFSHEDGNIHDRAISSSLHFEMDSLIKNINPDVIITYGSDGGHGHSDHRIIGNIVTEVFQKGEHKNSTQLLYYSQLKHLQNPKTPLGEIHKDRREYRYVNEKYLNYQVSYKEDNRLAAIKACKCHYSQFTSEEADDLFSILHQSNNIVYFRSFVSRKGIKHSVFE